MTVCACVFSIFRSRSHVLAAYASFLWEQDANDDGLGEGEQGTGGAGAPDQRAAPAQQAGQVRELASAAV